MSETNLQFKNLTEAQKSYVLSFVINKIFQNPNNYGLRGDGILRVGDMLDLRSIFDGSNRTEIVDAIEKAKQTILIGSPQEKSILENDSKIGNWVKDHPTETIDENKINEILNYKTPLSSIQEKIEIPKATKEINIPIVSSIEPQKTQAQERANQEIHQEIEEAKQRLAQLESESKPTNPALERTLASDSKHFISDAKFNQEVEQAFNSEIDGIYGKSGLLGFGKTSGINSKEWQEMAKLPASRVVEYYTGDSAKSGLPNDIIEKLSKSKNHEALMRQTAGLIEQANGAVKPFENENVEQFIKRLGGFVMRLHQQNLLKST